MKCYNCDKEIPEGTSICPFCHMKQRKNSAVKSGLANDRPFRNTSNTVATSPIPVYNNLSTAGNVNNRDRTYSRPDNLSSRPRPGRETKNGCNRGCKYSFAAIAVFLGIGIIITALVAMIGMTSSNDISDRTTSSANTFSTVPTLPVLTATIQQTWKPGVTVARETAIVPRYAEPSQNQNYPDPDQMFRDISENVNGRLNPLSYRIGYKLESFEFYDLGSEGYDLAVTASAAIQLIEPLEVSASLSDSKKYYLLGMKSLASAGDAFSRSESAYNAGDSTRMGQLVIAGKNHMVEAEKYLGLASDSLPAGYN